jgi:hypothetical protein
MGVCGLTKLLRHLTQFLRHLTKLLIQSAKPGRINERLPL